MLKVLAIAALATSATYAMADEKVITEDGIATFATLKPAMVRAEVGTTGYGGAIGWSVNPYTSIVAGYNGGDISWSDDIKVNGSKYDLDMDNKTAYLNAQIRPFANWFYMATGVGYLDNTYDIKGRANGDGTIKIDGTRYRAATGQTGTLTGSLKQDKVFAPYLGFGFAPAITNRWGVFGEVGAYYTGNPEASLTANNLVAVDPLETKSAQIAANNDARDLRNDKKYEWAPVAKVGVSFRF